MRKQARRLWFGDWYREDEPSAADADTVVVTQVDDEDAELTPEPRRRMPRGVVIGVAIAALAALAIALTAGGDNNKTRTTAQQPQTAPSQVPPSQAPQAVPQTPQGVPPQGFGGPDLTGPEAEKAARAALSQFPGDIERVTRGPGGGGYIVHVFQADGNEVHVVVDGQFHVQGSDAGGGSPGPVPGTSQ